MTERGVIMTFWSKRVLLGVVVFVSFSLIGFGVEIMQGAKMTGGTLRTYGAAAVVLFGFGYLLGMIWEHKSGFEKRRCSGKQYGVAVVAGLVVCAICGGCRRTPTLLS
ncbi:MAG: hypothetical protein FKY71_20500 [Spiribacter salinus]|uniref:Uncharacterized protein n=1 Tax=Spiribacter salinus TaxID=1335746 RepID=A0A540V0E3_9GAMM|nr:MAG: hypothetical protein FKY71_20500 [Spiribacter salinus]